MVNGDRTSAGKKHDETLICQMIGFLIDNIYIKDVRGWQFLTMKAAETLCIVCLPPEGIYFLKKYLGSRPSKKNTFYKGLTIKFAFLRIF